MSYKSGQATVRQTCVNIHFSVGGPKADNGQADIMLVQALFNYIAKSNTSVLGFSLQSMPGIDGRIGPKTRNAILSFQRRNSHKLLSVDGVVHPAKYEARVINLGGRLMTITLLDQFASQEALMRNDADHIQGLIKIEPRLAPWLV
jgi:hypothetical protein